MTVSLTDLITNFGDIIELNYDTLPTHEISSALAEADLWRPYNIRKLSNRRFGISVTSLDGGHSGVPDLDSLREYNVLNNTNYTEKDFKTRTAIAGKFQQISDLLDDWEPYLGRTHFLKLGAGGYFPPHRDNGTNLPTPYFRILVPISGFGDNEFKWLQEDKIIKFNIGRAYFVNTTKSHCLFSFVDSCIMLVLNVEANEHTVRQICQRSLIK
jgi:hypothetical protein